MEFNGFNIRTIIITVVAACLMCLLTVRIPHQNVNASTGPITPTIIHENHIPIVTQPQGGGDVDRDGQMKRMKEEMSMDRQQLRRIRVLKMKREETDLELEEQKALSELNKLKMDNLALDNGANPADSSNVNIRIEYLGGAANTGKLF
ncbi:MAG: hypothetical protein KGK03_05030 [Candidatus Omnitrophica bacterium]|nr:hypothetical protein [Candidatus Omnitrophota bacterium]MDE2222418.1 hypothetical protein [Candidatus Omnitrophota bacterium]